jgi:hypothetical protein
MSSLWRWMRIISRCCIPVCVEHVSSRTQGKGTCKKGIQRMTLTTCSPWEVWGLTLASRICETTAKYHKKWNYQYLKYHPRATKSSVKHPSFISSAADWWRMISISLVSVHRLDCFGASISYSFLLAYLKMGYTMLYHVIPPTGHFTWESMIINSTIKMTTAHFFWPLIATNLGFCWRKIIPIGLYWNDVLIWNYLGYIWIHVIFV